MPTLFNPENDKHDEYRPVLEWIVAGKGKIVYGGLKYKRELSKLKKYLRFITILKTAGKIHEIEEAKVNEAQEMIESKLSKTKFNDPHIVAIISVCGCKLLCSDDHKSFPFIKDRRLYLNDNKPPAIYSGRSNMDLLRDDNIANCCLPCCKGSKELKEYFSK